jgi:hypothetical protein
LEVNNFPELKEEFKDTKGIIRNRTSKKDKQCNGQIKKAKGLTTIYKTLNRKLKIAQHDLHQKPRVC